MDCKYPTESHPNCAKCNYVDDRGKLAYQALGFRHLNLYRSLINQKIQMAIMAERIREIEAGRPPVVRQEPNVTVEEKLQELRGLLEEITQLHLWDNAKQLLEKYIKANEAQELRDEAVKQLFIYYDKLRIYAVALRYNIQQIETNNAIGNENMQVSSLFPGPFAVTPIPTLEDMPEYWDMFQIHTEALRETYSFNQLRSATDVYQKFLNIIASPAKRQAATRKYEAYRHSYNAFIFILRENISIIENQIPLTQLLTIPVFPEPFVLKYEDDNDPPRRFQCNHCCCLDLPSPL